MYRTQTDCLLGDCHPSLDALEPLLRALGAAGLAYSTQLNLLFLLSSARPTHPEPSTILAEPE